MPRKDKNAVCVLHTGPPGVLPHRQARAQVNVEGREGEGAYLCLTCAEALAEVGVPVRWIDPDVMEQVKTDAARDERAAAQRAREATADW